ncbi:DUF4333 domain-containing protein [Nocardia heshunensis]
MSRTMTAALALMALALAGCSTDRAVDKKDVANEISGKLADQVGRKPEKVDCPANLPARKDATLTCTLTDQGSSYDVHVTVTSVEGDHTKFDIKVDDNPKN